MDELIQRIDSLRYSGETKLSFGIRIDVSNNQLSRYYRGRAAPSLAILERIANRTGCSLQWLRFGIGNQYPEPDVSRTRKKHDTGKLKAFSQKRQISPEARSLGFSTTRALDDGSLIVIIQSHMDNLVGEWSPEEREELKWMIAEIHQDPELRREILDYLKFAKVKIKKRRRHQPRQNF